MSKLKRGEFFGSDLQKLNYDDITITDTNYTFPKVDWHTHELPYVSYLVQGKLFEKNKKESYCLTPGSLMFHNWEEKHCNVNPSDFVRGFNIELSSNWFQKYDLKYFDFTGSIKIENPLTQVVMNKIFLETKTADDLSHLSVELLLLNMVQSLKNDTIKRTSPFPKWVKRLEEILHYEPEVCTSLSNLSRVLNIHPVHLSREFPKYFKTTIGDYIRNKKVNKAILLILNSKHSMTDICYECGFYDQSHFILNFKKIYKHTPLQFSKKIGDVNIIQF